MLKLFTAHNSICTQKVFLTLVEKDLPWTSEYIDLFNNEQYRPDYLKLNPKGVVPTLLHDGHAIIESTLICEYLDQTFPEPSLVPASAYARSQMRRWSKHIDEGVFEATREISFSAMLSARDRGQVFPSRSAKCYRRSRSRPCRLRVLGSEIRLPQNMMKSLKIRQPR